MSRKAIDMTGQRVHMLTVVSRAIASGKGAVWKCLCDCGRETLVRRSDLINPLTRSCGCFNATKSLSHGASKTQMYKRWVGMIGRCHNTHSKSYWRYGARGVSVCERWRHSFADFLADVGECPAGMSLDRYPDHAGNYEPGNVRWATPTEQARNTRRNHLHTIDGVTRCLAEWCEVLDEPWTTVKKRVAAGRDPFQRLRPMRNDRRAA